MWLISFLLVTSKIHDRCCLYISNLLLYFQRLEINQILFLMNDKIPYTRIALNENGESCFIDANLEMELQLYAPPAPSLYVKRLAESTASNLINIPAGWTGDFHPAPARQYVFCIRGEVKVEAGDGGIRYFKGGDIVFLEDIEGKGHKTTVVSEEAFVASVVVE